MTTYNLTVQLDPNWVKQWSGRDMKLCFSTTISKGAKNFNNVIAYTANTSPNTRITFTNEYAIAASSDQFTGGALINLASDTIPVRTGSKTQLEKDWSLTTNPSSDAPDSGFLFTNKVTADVVVCQKIQNEFKPVYISNTGPLPPNSTDVLIPKQGVYVWFSEGAQQSTMIDSLQGSMGFIDFTGKTNATMKFDQAGNWMNVQ